MSLSLVTSIETMVPCNYMYLGYFCGSSAMYMYIPHLLLLTLYMICIYINTPYLCIKSLHVPKPVANRKIFILKWGGGLDGCAN